MNERRSSKGAFQFASMKARRTESEPLSAADRAPNLTPIAKDDLISYIPDELLSLIFLFSLPSDRPPAMVVYEAPLSLAQVCSHWRSLAHSIPELWTSVHLLLAYFRPGVLDNLSEDDDEEEDEIENRTDNLKTQSTLGESQLEDPDDDNDEEEEIEEHRLLSKEDRILAQEDISRLPFIQSWFSHTRPSDSLKHLSISDEHIISNFDSPITDFVLDLLPRVETLDLMLCRRTLPRFTEFRPRAYERLRKLRLAGDAFEPGDWAFLLYDAPHLVEFDIRALGSSVPSLSSLLNWSQLTRLAVSYFNDPQDIPSVGVLLSVLRGCPNLESLRMVVRGDGVELEGVPVGQDEEESAVITLPNFHTLELEFAYSINALFDSLSLPSLAHIQLVEDRSRKHPPVPGIPSNALFHLLSRQRSLGYHQKIQKIGFEGVYYPSSILIECLEMVPSLKHLVCLVPLPDAQRCVVEPDKWLGFDDDVLAALTPAPGSTTSATTTSTIAPSSRASLGDDIDIAATSTPPPSTLCPALETFEIQYDWILELSVNQKRSSEAMVRFLRSRSSSFQGGGLTKLKKVVLPNTWVPNSEEDVEYAEFCSLRQNLRIVLVGPSGEEGHNDVDAQDQRLGDRWLSEGYWSEAWYQA
ncbi:hypothetical protein MD484_g2860, partial [Candolleomyces efflorescens]